MMKPRCCAAALSLLTLVLVLSGCGEDAAEIAAPATLDASAEDVTKVEIGKADSSAEAVFVDMDFAGELLSDSTWRPESQIEDQLLYTIGQLNGDDAVGRLDKLRLREIKTERVDGRIKITYRATLQVAWGRKNAIPATYTFKLPRDISSQALSGFAERYGHDCVDFGAHDVDAGSMWYYYRPDLSRCKLDAAELVQPVADVTLSPVNTSGRYPEYHKIWEDGVFHGVIVFGKYEDGATTASDAGIAAYNRFSQLLNAELRNKALVTEPAQIASSPGTAQSQLRYEATLDADHKVIIDVILVDNVRTAGPGFDTWYHERSSDADLIIYNGHAGLGANIRALASKGEWVEGQYVVVFMNGCDTYAYVDSALFDAHAAVNDDDPIGSKYVDIVTNAKPAFFASMPQATLAMVRGLTAYADPRTFEQIFRNVDSAQIVLVSGEEDNVYTPGYKGEDGGGEEPTTAWEGMKLEGEVTRDQEVRFETPELPAGTYTFMMEGTGDADLYIRAGIAPTAEVFDCRPYKASSAEVCEIELASPGVIHGMIRGWAPSSAYDLIGAAEE